MLCLLGFIKYRLSITWNNFKPVLLHSSFYCECVISLFVTSRASARLPAAKPVFKNPKVSSLYDRWQHVKQLAADRQSRLKNMLDRLNEVFIYIVFCVILFIYSHARLQLIVLTVCLAAWFLTRNCVKIYVLFAAYFSISCIIIFLLRSDWESSNYTLFV